MNPPATGFASQVELQALAPAFAAMDAVQAGVCLCDASGTIRWANAALGLSLGRSAAELTGVPVAAALHAEHAGADVPVLLRQAVQLPQTLVFQHRHGAAVRQRLQARPADGLPGHLWLTLVDVTHEVRAAQSSMATLDGLTAHVCVLDEQGCIVAVNRAWTRFAQANGGGAGTSIGMNYLSVCDAARGAETDMASGFAAGLREVLAGRLEVFESEYPCHSPGEHRWFMVVASRQPGSDPLRVVVAHQPVTRRKQAETRERTAQKMQALGTLAGGIAHDFNNVLGSILANATLAQQQLAPRHPALSEVDRIFSAGLKARDLVRQILAFSRSQPRVPRPRVLQPLLQDMLVLLRSSAPAGVSLDSSFASEPLAVMADATEVQQLLMNLCTNAWQSLEGRAGSIEVGLDAVQLDAGQAEQLGHLGVGRHVHLWVSDTGVGISAEAMPRIFDPFFTTKPAGQGTGLGLAVVHGVTLSMRGAVHVVSEPGVGSTFHVYLPALPADQANHEHQAPTASPAVAAGAAGRVLLLDDDDIVAITFQALLQHAGWQVTRFDKPSQALQALQSPQAAFDVVLTDQNMPEMSGLDFAEKVQLLLPNVPVVLITGSVTDELRHQAREVGVKRLVNKESAFTDLLPALQTVCRR